MDLAKDIKEEWFEEIDHEPITDLWIDGERYEDSFYSFRLELYSNEDRDYYMKRILYEPIGDYGTRKIEEWFKCIDVKSLESVLD